MKSLTVTLIGGNFHRQTVILEDSAQRVVRMILPINLTAKQTLDLYLEAVPVKFEEYARVDCIFGEFGVFPDNCFLLKGTDPVLFLKNLVRDYLK